MDINCSLYASRSPKWTPKCTTHGIYGVKSQEKGSESLSTENEREQSVVHMSAHHIKKGWEQKMNILRLPQQQQYF